MTEGSLLHQLEVRNERVHEVWWLLAGVGKHLVPSLFYAELGGSLGVKIVSLAKPLSDIWEKREGHREATENFSVFV